MDVKHTSVLRPGTRVAVYVGPHDVTGDHPLVSTATVIGPAEDRAGEPTVWLDVDIAAGFTLPQMYRVSEVLGVMMPLAEVSDDGRGTLTGTLSETQLREAGVDVENLGQPDGRG